jgi:uncharacterized protein
MNERRHFRDQIDDFIGHHPQSPLDHVQRATFAGLHYFADNEDLSIVVQVERFDHTEPLIEMETSTGDKRPYRRYGRFTFTVNGEDASLTIYSDAHGTDFFLPFRDATSGKETYGAGRYLDNHRPGLQQVNANEFHIDFNFAYNPYCAYSPRYSCPLPPMENWVKVPIEAGEKDFK